MVAFFIPAQASFRERSVAITDTDTTPPTTASPTFAAMNAGAPRHDRLLIAGIHFQDGQEDVTFSRTVTIGGVTASEIAVSGVAIGGDTSFSGIYAALVPEGDAVDVKMTLGSYIGNPNTWGCTLVRAVGLGSNTRLRQAGLSDSTGLLSLNTSGARFAFVVCGEANNDISADNPYSSSGSSVLTLGHRSTYGLAFIDTNPAGAATNYSIDSFATNNPNTIAAACWG